jgi:hypothetical protein
LSDGPQSLTLEGFERLMRRVEQVLQAVDRPLARAQRPAHAQSREAVGARA